MKLLKTFNAKINKALTVAQPQYDLISLFLLTNYLALIFLGEINFSNWPVLIMIHCLAVLLCALVIVRHWWPSILTPYFPLYWYLLLSYCLVFYPGLLLCLNGASLVSIMTLMLNMFFLLLTIDWLNVLIILAIGYSSAILCFYFTIQIEQQYPLVYFLRGIDFLRVHPNISLFYLWTIVVGLIFSRNLTKNRENLQLKQQISAMKVVAGSVAHELRTPLLTINSGLASAREYLNATESEPRNEQQQKHAKILSTAEREVISANTMIDMLLINLNQNTLMAEREQFSMVGCIEEVLTRYPFQSRQERQLVHFKANEDFMVTGNRVLLTHVFFNLIKNALYFIKAAEQGDLTLSVALEQGRHHVRVKDTGQGIASTILPHIFKQFYTRRKNGAGLGLAFCDMVMTQLGGSIECYSEQYHYTEFVLSFPKSENPRC